MVSETHLEMFLECYPAGLEAAGASGELIVDWLRAHRFAVMAIDEKARRRMPDDSIDLRTPSLAVSWSAHSTSTAHAIKTRPKMSTHSNTILVATHFIPYPPAHGVYLRILKLLKWLHGEGYRVILVMAADSIDVNALAELRKVTFAVHWTKPALRIE